MEKYLGFLVILRPLMILALSLNSGYVNAATFLPPEDKPLVRHYYKKLNTCANVEPFVRHQVKLFWDKDKTVTAKLLKLLYADCMLNVRLSLTRFLVLMTIYCNFYRPNIISLTIRNYND